MNMNYFPTASERSIWPTVGGGAMQPWNSMSEVRAFRVDDSGSLFTTLSSGSIAITLSGSELNIHTTASNDDLVAYGFSNTLGGDPLIFDGTHHPIRTDSEGNLCVVVVQHGSPSAPVTHSTVRKEGDTVPTLELGNVMALKDEANVYRILKGDASGKLFVSESNSKNIFNALSYLSSSNTSSYSSSLYTTESLKHISSSIDIFYTSSYTHSVTTTESLKHLTSSIDSLYTSSYTSSLFTTESLRHLTGSIDTLYTASYTHSITTTESLKHLTSSVDALFTASSYLTASSYEGYSLDMFKYQVGVDRGWYKPETGSSIITLSSDFNGFSRHQFPKYVYDIENDIFHTIIGFTGSLVFGGATQSRIDLGTNLGANNYVTQSLILKYNDVQNAYDTTQDTNKILTLNPIWGRYTDRELLNSGSGVTSGSTWTDFGPEIDMVGYNALFVYSTLLIGNAQNFRLRALAKDSSSGPDEYVLPIKTVGSVDVKVDAHYYEFNTDANQKMVLDFETNNGIPYIQLQHLVAAGGSGSITASIVKSFS